jgi:hypothetical protein
METNMPHPLAIAAAVAVSAALAGWLTFLITPTVDHRAGCTQGGAAALFTECAR